MLHESILKTIKETFLAEIPDAEITQDQLVDVSAYTLAYLEEKNLPVTEQNIMANADGIKAYIMAEGETSLANSVNAGDSIETRVSKLEKQNKILTAAGWIIVGVFFFYVFVVKGTSPSTV